MRVFGEMAMVHVNLTSPGTLMCSYYSSTIRPAFESRPANHAGHAGLLLKTLEPSTNYTVECSLHTINRTVQSSKRSFFTSEPVAPHLTITDVEPFATFARISVTSDTPGNALCLPQRHRFGETSLSSFARRAKRFHVAASLFVECRFGRWERKWPSCWIICTEAVSIVFSA